MITQLARLFGIFLILATIISFVLYNVPLLTGWLGADLNSLITSMATNIWWLIPIGGFLYMFGAIPIDKAGLATVAAIILLYFLFNPIVGGTA